jgi:uncharacterized protein (TIGR03435 family)
MPRGPVRPTPANHNLWHDSNVDLDLHWTPEQIPPKPTGAPEPSPTDASGPSIFAVVQEQLGLKLESTKGPADVLVIDHVERPTED